MWGSQRHELRNQIYGFDINLLILQKFNFKYNTVCSIVIFHIVYAILLIQHWLKYKRSAHKTDIFQLIILKYYIAMKYLFISIEDFSGVLSNCVHIFMNSSFVVLEQCEHNRDVSDRCLYLTSLYCTFLAYLKCFRLGLIHLIKKNRYQPQDSLSKLIWVPLDWIDNLCVAFHGSPLVVLFDP